MPIVINQKNIPILLLLNKFNDITKYITHLWTKQTKKRLKYPRKYHNISGMLFPVPYLEKTLRNIFKCVVDQDCILILYTIQLCTTYTIYPFYVFDLNAAALKLNLSLFRTHIQPVFLWFHCVFVTYNFIKCIMASQVR